MQINLTEQQAKSLQASCKAFNRLTGNRWSLQKFISVVVSDAVIEQARAAQNSNRLTQPFGQIGGRHVH